VHRSKEALLRIDLRYPVIHDGRIGSNPGTLGGEIFATLLHHSGSTERLVWSGQIEKPKVSNGAQRRPTVQR
jgi:hypothetical protein